MSRKKKFFLVTTALLLTTVSIIILFALYHLVYKDNIHTVIDGVIYRSATLSPEKLESLIQEKKIHTIFNLRGPNVNESWYDREIEIAESNGVKVLSIPFNADELPDFTDLNSLVTLLSTEERPILIHCLAGADRTGMASALALALEDDPELDAIKKQFSWRYGVVRFTHSIGPLLFAAYERWLENSGKRHSRDNLLFWIKNCYIDSKGNMEYWIDLVNERKFEIAIDGPYMVASADRASENLKLTGWAFDQKTHSPVESLSVCMDEAICKKVRFLIPRPDVADYFGLNHIVKNPFEVGWVCEFPMDEVSGGSHKIFFRIAKDNSEPLVIPTQFVINIQS